MRKACTLFLSIVWFQCAFATVFNVSISGNDNTGDGSATRPWRSLRMAASKVAPGAGHTIRISAGTFVEGEQIDIPVGINIEGAGIDQTIIKAASGFFYNPASPGFAPEKFLMSLESPSFSNGSQALKNFSIDGDAKSLHGGIFVKNRSNIVVENVKIQGTNFCGIWIWDVKNTAIKQVTLVNCSWGNSSWASGGLQLANLEDVEIVGLNVDENTGYGIKALGSGGNKITRLKVHDSRISVTPSGKWNNGSAPNISFELWNVYLVDCEIYNTYMDNHLSLVNVQTPPTGGRSIRVHHNIFDLMTRAGGSGYSIELSINDAEIDHNWLNGGSYGIAHWSPDHCANWSIHHNTITNLSSGWPGTVVRSQVSGLHNVKLYNNTIELSGTSTINLIGLYAGKSDNVEIRNNLFIDSNTSYSWGPNQLIFMEGGATLSDLKVTHNLFQKIPIGTISGTYSNNLTADPQITKSGVKPNPYYLPKSGSPLIDAGINVGFSFQGSAPDIGAHEHSSGVPANQLPSVALTSPADNSNFSAGSAITLNATASDNDGTITKVEFFNGTLKMGEDASSPYSFNWLNVPVGSYTITAKAVDNDSGVRISSPIKIVVASPNTLPIVSIASPMDKSSFTTESPITISVNASDNGTIKKIELFIGENKLGEDLSHPYTFIWKDALPGIYKITAKATDDQGGVSTSSAISITLSKPNIRPVVTITSPENNASYASGTTVTISAIASDEDGTITKVEFFYGNEKLGEDFTLPYDYTFGDLASGTYSVFAKVTDNLGDTTTSPMLYFSIQPANVDSVHVAESKDIPRYFTPNNDGINDVWEWRGVNGYNDSQLLIFNSSGQKIHEADSHQHTWDGTFNGKPLQSGAYYYIIRSRNNDTIKGAVRIVR